MRVNIILAPGDVEWIGGRFARELAGRLPELGIGATINGTGSYDLEYHQIVYGPPAKRPAVGMFTHGEERPTRYGPCFDGQVALNSRMWKYLRNAGCERPALIAMPVADDFKRETSVVFGVAGRVYGDGRKGEQLVANMVKAGFTVHAWGYGWPCRIITNKLEHLPAFYRGLDYYVDTSTDEGGCVPALECLAMGVPVISHTVGVDRPVIPYERGNWESLHAVLTGLTTVRTYADWAKEHAAYFRSILETVS